MNKPNQDEDSQDELLNKLRLSLIEGEESGDAEPGSFDRVRALIRTLARQNK